MRGEGKRPLGTGTQADEWLQDFNSEIPTEWSPEEIKIMDIFKANHLDHLATQMCTNMKENILRKAQKKLKEIIQEKAEENNGCPSVRILEYITTNLDQKFLLFKESKRQTPVQLSAKEKEVHDFVKEHDQAKELMKAKTMVQAMRLLGSLETIIPQGSRKGADFLKMGTHDHTVTSSPHLVH